MARCRWADRADGPAELAVGETVILLHLPLPSVGVPIRMQRGCQYNDSLADGFRLSYTEAYGSYQAADRGTGNGRR